MHVGKKQKPSPNSSGWVQVIVGLAIAVATVTAGTGHIVTSPRPPTGCVQLRVL
jgi:hypothetical protein